MINLAGKDDCDETIMKEIEEAGLQYNKVEWKTYGEVKSNYLCSFHGWIFERLWYYWDARTCKTPLLFMYADELHESHGECIRVCGDSGCPAPREIYHEKYDIGVNIYHIDTQAGLNELIKMIDRQTNEKETHSLTSIL